MKMYAMYDTVTEKYATSLEFPYFCRKNDWSDSAFNARLHKTPSTMKAAMTRLMKRLELNINMLKNGDWDGPGRHFKMMKNWGIECERRQADKLVNFGMVIVEVDDSAIAPVIV